MIMISIEKVQDLKFFNFKIVYAHDIPSGKSKIFKNKGQILKKLKITRFLF